MPILSRRCAAEKSSLRSLNALPSKAFRAFDPTRGGLPPPRAPPPQLERIHLYRGFGENCKYPGAPLLRSARIFFISYSFSCFDAASPEAGGQTTWNRKNFR